MSQLSAPTLIGAALAVGLAGCVSSPREPAAPEPFVFRSLDLRQQNGTGEPAWDLTSPEARYDLIRQLAQARRPQGTIYRNGKPHITIKALRGTVIGDGQAIQLEGEVLITLLGRNPVRSSGDAIGKLGLSPIHLARHLVQPQQHAAAPRVPRLLPLLLHPPNSNNSSSSNLSHHTVQSHVKLDLVSKAPAARLQQLPHALALLLPPQLPAHRLLQQLVHAKRALAFVHLH